MSWHNAYQECLDGKCPPGCCEDVLEQVTKDLPSAAGVIAKIKAARANRAGGGVVVGAENALGFGCGSSKCCDGMRHG